MTDTVVVSIQTVNNESAQNFSLNEFVLKNLGHQHMGYTVSVILSFIYCLVFISGTVGNVCTCIVIVRNNYMQTTTNYYLFSLAVSDLLLLLFGLPPELYAIWEAYPWRFGETFCILRQSVMEMTSYASVLTITAFTVERYVAICRPLQAHRLAGFSRCLRIIIAIWFVSLLVALPYSIHTRLFHELHHPLTHQAIPESLICNIRPEWRARMTYMFQVSTFLFFFTPVVVIICLYILIGIALRKSALGRGSSDEGKYGSTKCRSRLPSQPRRVVVRMLVAVTAAFILCWAPFHAQRLLVLYVSQWTPLLMDVQSTLFYISGVLYFVSSTVNPILYNVISRRYRIAFRETICICCRESHGSFTYTSSVIRGYSERTLKHPMVLVNRDTDSHHVTFQEEPTAVNQGSGKVSMKSKLLEPRSGKVKGDARRSDSSSSNGYAAPHSSVRMKGYCDFKLLNGILKKKGSEV